MILRCEGWRILAFSGVVVILSTKGQLIVWVEFSANPSEGLSFDVFWWNFHIAVRSNRVSLICLC